MARGAAGAGAALAAAPPQAARAAIPGPLRPPLPPPAAGPPAAGRLARHQRPRARRGDAQRHRLLLGERRPLLRQPPRHLGDVLAVGPGLDLAQRPVPVGGHEGPLLRQRLEAEAQRGVADLDLLHLQHQAVELATRGVRRLPLDAREERLVERAQAIDLALHLLEPRGDRLGAARRAASSDRAQASSQGRFYRSPVAPTMIHAMSISLAPPAPAPATPATLSRGLARDELALLGGGGGGAARRADPGARARTLRVRQAVRRARDALLDRLRAAPVRHSRAARPSTACRWCRSAATCACWARIPARRSRPSIASAGARCRTSRCGSATPSSSRGRRSICCCRC